MSGRLELGAIAVLLATGGWVCESNVENRCPGALTCDIEVSNVCCPFDQPYWCDGCVADSSKCITDTFSCGDRSRVLPCSFSAHITTAHCTLLGGSWELIATGTVEGCGQETAFIDVDDKAVDADCGSWEKGVYFGCVPRSPDVSTMMWTLDLHGVTGVVAPPTTIDVRRGHGTNAVLDMMGVACN